MKNIEKMKEKWHGKEPRTQAERTERHHDLHPNDLGKRTNEWQGEGSRYVSIAGLGTASYRTKVTPVRRVRSAYTVKDLKQQCRDYGLPVTGTKAVLIERIGNHEATIGDEE